MLGVVQQKNTLKEAIKLFNPKAALTLNPAILKRKEKFKKCILEPLSSALDQEINLLNTFTSNFTGKEELVK